MYFVFEAGRRLGKGLPVGGEDTEVPDLRIGYPDFGNESGTSELGESECVQFIGLDARFGNGTGFDGVGHKDVRSFADEEIVDGPDVSRCFQSNDVLRFEPIGEASQAGTEVEPGWVDPEWGARWIYRCDYCIVLVNVQTDETHMLPPADRFGQLGKGLPGVSPEG
jgi:hypothetical protein